MVETPAGAGMDAMAALDGTSDPDALDNDLIEISKKMCAEHDIASIVLECTAFPPAAYKIQDAVHRPVWDINTMIEWVYTGVVRGPYTGIM